MSLFGKLFGGPGGAEKKRPADVTEQMDKTRNILELLEKKSDHLGKQIKGIEAEVKKIGTKNKAKVMPLLKRRARLQKQQGQIYGQMENLEALMTTLDNAHLNKDVIQAMRDGHKAVTSILGDPDDIADVVDDLSDMVVQANEVSDALATPMFGGEIYDEDDLLAEFESEMAEEEEESALLDIPDAPTGELEPNAADLLPDAPSASLSKAQQDEVDELAAWAS